MLVAVYLALNAVVVGVGLYQAHRRTRRWSATGERALTTAARQPAGDDRASPLLVFPKLALGLSGFETGVAVMPLVKGDPTDTPSIPTGGSATPEAADHRRR